MQAPLRLTICAPMVASYFDDCDLAPAPCVLPSGCRRPIVRNVCILRSRRVYVARSYREAE
jgi:hypothetical protein